LSERITEEFWIGKDPEGSGDGLTEATIAVFALMNSVNPRKPSVTKASLIPTEIQN
jgi:hypothetical protein